MFWVRSKDPLHVALLGSHICMEMYESIFLGKKDVMARATRMESWAVAALNMAPDSRSAATVLSARMGDIAKSLPLLDLALMIQMKKFLSHRHAVSMAEQRWRGKSDKSPPILPEQINWFLVFFYICFPCFNAYVVRGTLPDDNGSLVADRKRGGGARAVLDGISLVLKASRGEHEKLTKKEPRASRDAPASHNGGAAGGAKPAKRL